MVYPNVTGFQGLSDDVPELILQYIQREDIAPIRKRVEHARDGLKRDWGAETYQAFLIDLDMLDDVDPGDQGLSDHRPGQWTCTVAQAGLGPAHRFCRSCG